MKRTLIGLLIACVLSATIPIATAHAERTPALSTTSTHYQEPASIFEFIMTYAIGGTLMEAVDEFIHQMGCERILEIWMMVGDAYGYDSSDAYAVTVTFEQYGCGRIITH